VYAKGVGSQIPEAFGECGYRSSDSAASQHDKGRVEEKGQNDKAKAIAQGRLQRAFYREGGKNLAARSKLSSVWERCECARQVYRARKGATPEANSVSNWRERPAADGPFDSELQRRAKRGEFVSFPYYVIELAGVEMHVTDLVLSHNPNNG
jgi:hypothetical protein